MTRKTFNSKAKHFLLSAILQCVLCNFAVAEGKYFSWDFADCDLEDIVYAVSLDSGISIVTDDTVSGKGNLKFSGDDFETAFESFLTANRLYVKRDEKVWTVSRFSMVQKDGLFYLDVCDLIPSQIIEKISGELDDVITFDSLPVQKISVHFKGIDKKTLIDSIAKRFGSYDVICENSGYHIAKKNETRLMDSGNSISRIERLGDGYAVDVRDCTFVDTIERLFELEKNYDAEKSFCLLVNKDTKIQRLVFNGYDFTETLQFLCSLCNFTYVLDENVFYIFSEMNSKNELITGKKEWKKISLSYVKAQDFLTFIYSRLGKVETIVLPDEFSLLCLVSESEIEVINQLITDVDIKQETYLVNLKYIKPAQLFEHLPPSIDKNLLFLANDNECVYFRGSEEAYKSFCQQLELCDKPEKSIRYDLLILQYDETNQNTWSSSFDCNRLSAGDRNGVSAVLGSVMGFNLNVVTAFGVTFAAELQNSIEENKTKVYADTTLYGISGKQINFQNTNTYRYRDNNVDPETGIPIYSGVTREIVSGIQLDVLGWVSGDGMITSKVTASVSRCGTDTSASTGNPPPTSEKVVTTEVCGKSGEPVILSGLIQTSDSNQQKRAPVISKIPLIGNLFKNTNKTSEKSQMIIYLVPHVDSESDEGVYKSKIDSDFVMATVKKLTDGEVYE